jgi:DNA primase
MNHKMRLENLKQIANENITQIFDSFDLKYIDKYEYYQMVCPLHEGSDNPTAFSWVKDKGYFRCFTRHCEQDGADIFDFVQKFKKCTLIQARDIVASIVITGKYNDTQNANTLTDAEFQKYIKNNAKKIKDFKVFDIKCLKDLKEDKYLINRGFSKDVINEFLIGYCDNPKSYYFNHTCIPIFHHDGKLIGFTARVADENYKERQEPKWKHTPGLPKSQILFNLNKAKEHIKKTHTAILVEGPLDVLKFWMAGIYGVCAVLGSELSGPQRSLLLQQECFDLILAFDSDAAGIECTSKVISSCKSYFNILRYDIPDGKDIGDLLVEEIHKLHIISI